MPFNEFWHGEKPDSICLKNSLSVLSITGLRVWDGLHPDGGYVEHITWLEKDNRAYEGTTGDWLISALEDEGSQRPQPQPKKN